MKPSEILSKAREHLADPDNWYQGDMSKPGEPTCVCALEAINRAAASLSIKRYYPLIEAASGAFRDTVNGSIVVWNDMPSRKHSEVLDAFDKAIELAVSRGE